MKRRKAPLSFRKKNSSLAIGAVIAVLTVAAVVHPEWAEDMVPDIVVVGPAGKLLDHRP
jgi:hypothetical protein